MVFGHEAREGFGQVMVWVVDDEGTPVWLGEYCSTAWLQYANGFVDRLAELLVSGLAAATTRKAVFALRQCLDAAVADNRRLTPPKPGVGTAVEVRGRVTLGNEPKMTRSKRSVPIARSVMRRIEIHLADHVAPEPDALVFVGPRGGPMFRSFGRQVWHPSVQRAGLGQVTFHGLRHSFVAIQVAAGCNVREVSEWAGHNSVAFTLTRYGGLFEDDTDAAVDRLDDLLGGSATGGATVRPRRGQES